MSGSSATHWKVPFEWTKETAPPDELPAGAFWATGADIAEPVGLVAAVLETSPGAEDLHAVATLGSDGAARRVLALEPGFSYQEDRWHVLMLDAAPAGFVLPVIYGGCARDALDEATIYHLGVAPAHRGAGGIGRLLLRRCNQHSRTSRSLADLLRHAREQRADDPPLRAGRMDAAAGPRTSRRSCGRAAVIDARPPVQSGMQAG